MDEAKRIVEQSHQRGDFTTLECGYKFFWVENRGAFTAGNLRALADELDAMNKDWDEQVKKDMGRVSEELERIMASMSPELRAQIEEGVRQRREELGCRDLHEIAEAINDMLGQAMAKLTYHAERLEFVADQKKERDKA